jgi:hypothetical protein
MLKGDRLYYVPGDRSPLILFNCSDCYVESPFLRCAQGIHYGGEASSRQRGRFFTTAKNALVQNDKTAV